jgi:AAA family ATP:ADP antiporter
VALGLIDIRAGEKRGLVLMSGILALITASHTLLETARDTLFLTKMPPERLALVYVVLALLAVIASNLSGLGSKRFGRRAGLVTSLCIVAFSMVLLSLREATPTMVFVLYLASGVAGTVITLQFWLLVGQFFTVAQGKRLFGPMAAGGVLGATLGAALAALLLRYIPAESLIVVGGGLFLTAAAVVTFIPQTEGIDDVDLSPTRFFAWLHDFRLLRSHRYVALIAALSFVSVSAVLLADYLFKSSAATTLGPARLGTFLGTYYAVQNAVSLVVQVLLTGAIVRKLGVTTALIVFPVLLALGGLGAFVTGAFAMTVVVKGTDGALRHSLHRVTSELLLLPLASDVRDRSKRLLETVFGRGSQAFAALSIVALAWAGLATVKVLALLVSLLALAWLAIALWLRVPYLDLFRRALARGELGSEDQELDLAAVGALLESLASVEEANVLAAIDLIERSGRRNLLPALILYHESPRVLERALTVFAQEPRRDFMPLAERLLGVSDARVRASAVRALARAGGRAAAESALADADPRVSSASAFFLADAESAPHEAAPVQRILSSSDDDTPAKAALVQVIAEYGDSHWQPTVHVLAAQPKVVKQAGSAMPHAIRRTGATEFAKLLVQLLEVREVRASAREALVSFGSDGEAVLAAALRDRSQPITLRREAPLALASFGTQSVVDLLVQHLEEEDALLSHRVLRALGRLSADSKAVGVRLRIDRAMCERMLERHLTDYLSLLDTRLSIKSARGMTIEDEVSLSLLEGLLSDRSANHMERAFRFLQLANRNEDIRPVFEAVVRGDKRARATAMEFLDALTLGEAKIRDLLRVIADDLEPEERVRRGRSVRQLPAELPSAEATLATLISDGEPLLAALALACARSTREGLLAELVTQTRVDRPEVIALATDVWTNEVARA